MNNQVNHVPKEQLFRSDDQIIEGMQQNNKEVLGKLRKEEGQTIFSLRNHITLDEVIDDNFYYDKKKELENKIEIISDHSGMYNYGTRMEKVVRCIIDDADKPVLIEVEKILDLILKEIVEE